VQEEKNQPKQANPWKGVPLAEGKQVVSGSASLDIGSVQPPSRPSAEAKGVFANFVADKKLMVGVVITYFVFMLAMRYLFGRDFQTFFGR